jgi:2',3'-cyclic-nucleotide 2'-phosphodiesterase / 3'-nucleotidase
MDLHKILEKGIARCLFLWFLSAKRAFFITFSIRKINNPSNMKLRIFALWALLLVTFAASAREIKIQVVATADVHGILFSYDFVNDQPLKTSMANVHYMMQAARARSSNNIILLDNGDLIQGSPAAYYANFVQDHRRNLFSRVLNLMKYDAATVGNHDIEAGPEVYNRLIREFNFPYLGANVLNAETGEPHFKPYTIIERERVRVAVLGLTTTGVPNWLPPHLWEGLEFQSMVEAAQYWVPYILENEQPDALVGLFHSGMGPQQLTEGQPEPESVSQYIARTVPGFDVVFTGHDHRERVEFITNAQGEEVLILGPGHFAETLAVAEFTFERNGRRNFTKKDLRGELVSTKNVVPSREYMRAFEKDIAAIAEYSNQPVGVLKNSMASLDAVFGSAPFTDLIHQIQLDLAQADISFTAPLVFNEVLPAGTMRVRDFFKLYQFENYLYAMELTGQEIQDYLEYSYSLWLNPEMSGPGDHLLWFRTDEAGNVDTGRSGSFRLRHPYFNFDSAAGLRYSVDVSRPVGQRVTIHSMEDGTPFRKEQTYRVAINSYRGSGGGGHLTTGAGIDHGQLRERIVYTTQTDLRSKLINYFREQKEVGVESRNNWEIVPRSWAEQGRQKDMEYVGPAGNAGH